MVDDLVVAVPHLKVVTHVQQAKDQRDHYQDIVGRLDLSMVNEIIIIKIITINYLLQCNIQVI